jgi:hypothetical protein
VVWLLMSGRDAVCSCMCSGEREPTAALVSYQQTEWLPAYPKPLLTAECLSQQLAEHIWWGHNYSHSAVLHYQHWPSCTLAFALRVLQ